MSSRMTNLELSTSIKDYIKELFEGNIKLILENNTETIIKLNEKIDELIIKIDNIDKKIIITIPHMQILHLTNYLILKVLLKRQSIKIFQKLMVII